jgi:hypothetical protein
MSMRSENGAFRKSYKGVVSDSSMEAPMVPCCVNLSGSAFTRVAGLPGCRVAEYKIWPGLTLPRQA